MAAPIILQGLVAAVSTGIVAFVGRRLLRRANSIERIDPFTLTDPWRSYVQNAQSAHARFGRVVGAANDGPLRERLVAINGRIDEGVTSCWRIAGRGHSLHKMLLEVAPDARGSESVARMRATENDIRAQLAKLVASLDEAVARAAELASHRTDNLEGVAGDVNDVVADLDALRQAVVEVDRAAEPPQV